MTDDEVLATMMSTSELIKTAGLPEHLEGIAFGRVLDLRLLARAPIEPTIETDEVESQMRTGPTWMNALATYTGATLTQLEEIYFDDDEGMPCVGVDVSTLGTNAASRTRKLVLLLAGARQVGGIEETTNSDVLREACKRYGVYDSSNFGGTLNGMTNWLHVQGPSRSRSVRIKPSGRDAFRELLAELGIDRG